MPAGSVRLPELRQDIKIDTKDLDRAIAAARRFKTEMDRSLGSGDTGNLDRSFADLEQRIARMSEANAKLRSSTDELGASFRRQVADVDRFATSMGDAEASMRRFSSTSRDAFNIDTSKWVTETDKVSATMRSLAAESRQLLTSQQELGSGFRDTRRDADEAAAALARLQAISAAARDDLHRGFDVDISRWRSQMNEARQVIQGLRDDTQDAAVAAELLGTAMRGVRGDVDGSRDSLAGFAAEARQVSGALNGAFDVDTARWRTEINDAREVLRGLRDDTQDAAVAAELLGEAMRGMRGDLDGSAVSMRALATDAAQVADALARIDFDGFNRDGHQTASTLRELAELSREFAASQEDVAEQTRRAGEALGATNGPLGEQKTQMEGLAQSTRVEEAETAKLQERLGQLSEQVSRSKDLQEEFGDELDLVGTKSAEAARKVEAATEKVTAARERAASAAEKITAAEERLALAEANHERTGAALEEAHRKIDEVQSRRHVSADALAAAEAALAAAEAEHATSTAKYYDAESKLNDSHRERDRTARAVTAAEQELADSQLRLIASHDDVKRSGDGASQSLRNIERDTRNLARGTSLGARAVKELAGGISLLGKAGVIAGGIGVLGGAVIGLGAAAGGAVPIALGLSGALGGLGVTVAGLKAIFTDNKGLEPAVESLKKAFSGIQDDLQNRVNPGLKAFLSDVEGLAPMVRRNVPAFAAAFNELVGGAREILRDSGFQRDLEAILQSGIRQFEAFGNAGLIAFRGIIGLATETGPFIERLGELAQDAAIEFRDWVAEARRTGEITALLNHATDVLVSLGRTVRDLAVGFKNLFNASNVSGFTDAVLSTLTGIAADFRRFTAERQADLQAMFRNLSGQVQALRPLFGEVADAIRVILTNIDLRPLIEGAIAILPNLAGGLVEAANAASRLGREAAPVINSLITLIRGLIGDAERIGTAFLRNVKPAIDAISPGVQRLGDALAKIAESVLPPLGGALRNLGQAASELIKIVAPVAEFVGSIVGLLGDMSSGLGVVLSAVLALKVGQAIFGGMGRSAEDAQKKTGVLGRAFQGLTSPLRAAYDGTRTLARGTLELARGNETLVTSQSGVLRGLGSMREAYQTTSTRVQESARNIANAATTSATGSEGAFGRIQTGLLNTGVRFAELSQNAQVHGGRMGQALGNAGVQVTSSLSGMVNSFGGAITGMGRLAGAAGGAGAALSSGIGRAASGLVDFLGGPWGVAFAAATVALTSMAQESQQAKADMASFAEAAKLTGQASEDAGAQTASHTLALEGFGDTATEAGTNLTALGTAITGTEAEFQAMQDSIYNSTTGANSFGDALGNLSHQLFGTDTGSAGLRDRNQELRDAFLKAREEAQRQREELTRQNSAMTEAERVSRNVAKGFDTMRQSAGDASKEIDGLKQVMDGLRGATLNADEAEKNFGDALRSLQGAVTDTSGPIRILNGDLDASSEAGGRALDASIQLRDATLEQAQAAFNAAGGQQNLAGATDAARGAIEKGKKALVDSLTQMGVSREEAQKYADSLFNIPAEVLTKILADPANAQKTYEQWKAGIPADPNPAKAPVDGNVAPLNKTLEDAKREIFTADPTKAPIGGNTNPLDKDAAAGRDNVEGTPADLPIHAALRGNGLAETEVEAFVARINGYPAAKLPIGANVAPGEQEALAWVARINGYAEARLPIHANLEPLNLELSNRIAELSQGRVDIPIYGDFSRFTAEYDRLLGIATTDQRWIVHVRGDFAQLAAEYDRLLQIAVSDTRWVVHVFGDFSALAAEYDRIVQIISSTPVIIPIYGQFMGLIGGGGAGGGGGGGGGGTIGAANGLILENFAEGGMSARDKATLKKLAGVQHNANGNVAGQLQAAMGLTPMAADQAQIVGPNTWRVVGDRAVGDEAFIPLVNTPRSHALLEEAASRMGYVLSKFAAGGFGNASSNTTAAPVSDGGYTSVQNTSNQEAPLIGGDLVLTIPQDTPVQDAFDEATFQLRRLKRGGVHVRNKARGR